MAESKKSLIGKSRLSPQTSVPNQPEQERYSPEPDLELIDRLNTNRANRWLRGIYAAAALILATVSVWFWIYFVLYVYQKGIHSDMLVGVVTTGCTVNILTAFISISKGLFPQKNNIPTMME